MLSEPSDWHAMACLSRASGLSLAGGVPTLLNSCSQGAVLSAAIGVVAPPAALLGASAIDQRSTEGAARPGSTRR